MVRRERAGVRAMQLDGMAKNRDALLGMVYERKRATMAVMGLEGSLNRHLLKLACRPRKANWLNIGAER